MQAIPSKCSVCVIGSGAGGATLAYWLASKGVDTVLIERGEWRDERENGDKWDNDELHAYAPRRQPNSADKEYSFTRLNEQQNEQNPYAPSKMGYGFDLVGGLTAPYAAAAWRFYKEDFEKGTQYASSLTKLLEKYPSTSNKKVELLNWPEGFYRDMAPYYALAEKIVGVSGDAKLDPATEATRPYSGFAHEYMPPLAYERPNELLAVGARKLGLHPFHIPMAINSIDRPRSGSSPLVSNRACKSCNYCSGYNCVWNAKNSVDASILAPARENSLLKIVTRASARRIVHTKTSDGLVRCTSVTIQTKSDSTEHSLKCDHVFVAVGAILAPRLLKLSNVPVNNEIAGRFLTLHIDHKQEFILPGEFEFRMVKKLAVMDQYLPSQAEQEKYVNHMSIQTGSKAHPIAAAKKEGIWGGVFVEEFQKNYMQTYELQTVGEDLPQYENWIDQHPTAKDDYGDPLPVVWHKYHPIDLVAAQATYDRMRKIIQESGGTLRGPSQIDSLIKLAPSGSHLMGTLRMGDNPKNGEQKFMVNRDGRLHGTQNIYIVDGSIFTTSAGVNPALTLQANALRVGDIFLKKYA